MATHYERPETAHRLAIDIGSTVVKVGEVDSGGRLVEQELYPRDHEAGISRQVESLLTSRAIALGDRYLRICSSANGGLRVGIVCLTKRFSGATLRNQVLLAGANPAYVRDFEEPPAVDPYVDLLVVAGGIDEVDAAPLRERLLRFRRADYRAGAVMYAGNATLAEVFLERCPEATVISNPIADSLRGRQGSVFEAVRRAYLDDLVYKEGVSELSRRLSGGIRPTPEVVSRGFQRAVLHRANLRLFTPCVLLDIGGATTDLHYTTELVRDDSPERPPAGSSVGRYVFTDLGVASSRDSTILQLRGHPRLYDFVARAATREAGEIYRQLREGETPDSEELLALGCLFLALDRFARGRGPGLPVGDLGRVAQLALTGGAGRNLREETVAQLLDLFRPPRSPRPAIEMDGPYGLWIEGIFWDEA